MNFRNNSEQNFGQSGEPMNIWRPAITSLIPLHAISNVLYRYFLLHRNHDKELDSRRKSTDSEGEKLSHQNGKLYEKNSDHIKLNIPAKKFKWPRVGGFYPHLQYDIIIAITADNLAKQNFLDPKSDCYSGQTGLWPPSLNFTSFFSHSDSAWVTPSYKIYTIF